MDAQEFWEDYQHLKKEANKLRISEQRLQGIRARYQTLLEGDDDPVIVIDREGRIVEVNAAAERHLNLDRSDTPQRDAADVFADSLASEIVRRARRAIESDTRERFDWYVAPMAGPSRVFATSALPVRDESNRAVAAVCIAREITHLVAIEEDIGGITDRVAQLFEELKALRDRTLDVLDRARS